MLENEVWSERERDYGRWRGNRNRERSREMRSKSRWPIYRSSIILDSLRGVERSRALKGLTDATIEQVSRAKRSSMDRRAIKQLSRRQKLSRWIEVLSRSCWDCNKKKMKSSIENLVIKELSWLLKNSFSKKRRTQIWMQSNILLNQWPKQHFKPSKSSLNNKNDKHLDPKTHTHTLNKSNQIYISKTS